MSSSNYPTLSLPCSSCIYKDKLEFMEFCNGCREHLIQTTYNTNIKVTAYPMTEEALDTPKYVFDKIQAELLKQLEKDFYKSLITKPKKRNPKVRKLLI